MIHVVVGTKAQYTKMAPLLALMDRRNVTYRLVDTGQHARFNRTLRPSIGVREPDVQLAGDDAATVTQGLRWILRMIGWWFRRRRLVTEVFTQTPGATGVAVIHGDTASTLIGALLARRAGLKVALVEAGLRSGSFLNPFPEEAIRTVVPRMSHLLLPPDEPAEQALARMRVKGHVVPTAGNTVAEVLFDTLTSRGASLPEAGGGPVLMQLHRMENVRRRRRREAFVDLAIRLAAQQSVRFVVHPATHVVLERTGALDRMTQAGVSVSGLLPSYREFVALLASATFVVTDGASLQEECAALGVPTLLWRSRTERPDGIDRNVVLSAYDQQVVDGFLADPQSWRRPPTRLETRPSERVLDALEAVIAPSDASPDEPGGH